MNTTLFAQPLAHVLEQNRCVGEFLHSLGLNDLPLQRTLGEWLERLSDEAISDAGMERTQIGTHLEQLIAQQAAMRAAKTHPIQSLTVQGGHDKQGIPEAFSLSLKVGDIVCIVGPTGSGKSRLLGDIECLAQGDTPSGRRVWVNGQAPDESLRFSAQGRLVAQISQNMNFVIDLSVADFIHLHARCRMVDEPEPMVERVIQCANALTGEQFAPSTSVTQLSGGQTRALMIADAALLSASPIVLIDEIENAGVDRRRALDLLMAGDKIVLISTHDPLLALCGTRRCIIRNGGIADILNTSAVERANLLRLETIDAFLMELRTRLRAGQRLEEHLPWPN